ncbi:similar to Saccharomyces cerevisiae YPR001W CIT3 Dual specificity mitochondrial citrate and methylcitrate synthase [Maudiozyma barnettii]|uniref:Citrate synthase n=1 Tax=Maudiozyma barnettii TaxID=61262 RepID=A0A8H2VF83_9SACH|nr:citrate (Si)-synthase CIT3 [Kazachstania barnettii]CAB4254380.1 similar to Saccharomyces cerevisiae YPR001W CIT3 Dual specificity mitochondrial citrate and methylcitrate synthase [Kazachstania barnettii]CAD1782271.1 similar to Saccharomyces cerevisiae YPR001W CIT3 Dual specificity mitochondrial citrate and methylcitrate synthase [Kazachstania barnettii]
MLRKFTRVYSSVHSTSLSSSALKDTLRELIPLQRSRLKDLKTNHSNVKIDNITVGSIIGGMRGNQSMLWDGTTLSPNEGIKFKGMTIKQCQDSLPGIDGIFLPESMIWLLLTGKIPTMQETKSITNLFNEILKSQNNCLPIEVDSIMNNLPKDLHPMTQLSIGLECLSNNSSFANLYKDGKIGKNDYWDSTFDDSMVLIANLPLLIGKIYSNLINNGKSLGSINNSMDWSYNICSMLGMTSTKDSINKNNLNDKQLIDFNNLMRLYLGIHVDHEGGNVSAHTTHLVGSTLADPFLSYASGINGLAGPLHGLAAQEVVRFLINLEKNVNDVNDNKLIESQIWEILNSNKVIPGYGHAVLRKPDPRFNVMLEFVENRQQEFQDDPHVQLMQKLSTLVPSILLKHGKCNNPYPNVDAASGILFYHYGIQELLFFTVIFGCSRSIGPLVQLIWDRIYGLPIERPKSLDLKTLEKLTTSRTS